MEYIYIKYFDFKKLDKIVNFLHRKHKNEELPDVKIMVKGEPVCFLCIVEDKNEYNIFIQK